MSLGFAGNLVMNPKNGAKRQDLNFDDYNLNQKKNKNEVKFRSTFHNTISGKFLDLPPLDKHGKRKSKNGGFDPSKRSSMNNFPTQVPRSSTNVNPYQTSSGFYRSRGNVLPDAVHSSSSNERPKNRGRPN